MVSRWILRNLQLPQRWRSMIASLAGSIGVRRPQSNPAAILPQPSTTPAAASATIASADRSEKPDHAATAALDIGGVI